MMDTDLGGIYLEFDPECADLDTITDGSRHTVIDTWQTISRKRWWCYHRSTSSTTWKLGLPGLTSSSRCMSLLVYLPQHIDGEVVSAKEWL
jgi:hypothetical protein